MDTDPAGTDGGAAPLQAAALQAAGSAGSVRVGLRPLDLRPPADVAGTAHTGRLQG